MEDSLKELTCNVVIKIEPDIYVANDIAVHTLEGQYELSNANDIIPHAYIAANDSQNMLLNINQSGEPSSLTRDQVENPVLEKTLNEIPVKTESTNSTEKANKPVFNCAICDIEFNRKGDYSKHVRIHMGDRPFVCKICGRKFAMKSILTSHLMIHSGVKSFECNECDHKCYKKSDLTRHMRVHTGELPYACKECGKQFNDSSNFRRHMRIHTGETPFECKECGKKYTQNSALKSHLMRMHILKNNTL